MIKLLWLLFLAAIACRLLTGRWPWRLFTSRPRPSGELDAARAVLGVRAGATRADILDAHRRTLSVVHPDRGGTSEQVHEANAARDLLIQNLPQQTESRP